METRIIYMTAHGCSRKAAMLIRNIMPGKPVCIDLEKEQPGDLSATDLLIIGGSIRIGKIQKRIRKFCERELDLLLTKKIGLYICCMHEGEKAGEQLRANFPEPLLAHATATGIFGGELDFEVMNAFERMIIQDIIGVTMSVSLFSEQPVREFCARLQGRL